VTLPVSTLALLDTSAYTVSRRSKAAQKKIQALALNGMLATFVTVDLELGYSARNATEHAGIRRVRAALIQLPSIDAIAQRAREVQTLMADRGHHRAAGIVDLLTAAAGEHYGAAVVHYDADFDHIATVTGQTVKWIVPQGSA